MARTKADAGKKAGGKAPRKAAVLKPTATIKSGGPSKRRRSTAGRNSVCKRPVPDWQVPIGEFLTKSQMTKEAAAGAPPPEDVEVVDLEVEEGPSTSAAASLRPVAAMLTPESQSDESMNADQANEEKELKIADESAIEESGMKEENEGNCAEKSDVTAEDAVDDEVNAAKKNDNGMVENGVKKNQDGHKDTDDLKEDEPAGSIEDVTEIPETPRLVDSSNNETE